MNVDDPSRAVFGRRRREMRSPAAPVANPAAPARVIGRIAPLVGLASLLLAVAGASFWTLLGLGELNAEIARTEERVVKIVNQPITHLPRSGPVTVFSPGWFHPGATRPDFDNVDIRATQEFPYDGSGYVTSDVSPSEIFVGSELEFNAMTKYFYADRTLPKKRLSGAEMVEINGLYRLIGRDEMALSTRWRTLAGMGALGVGLAFGLLLLIRRTFALPAR